MSIIDFVTDPSCLICGMPLFLSGQSSGLCRTCSSRIENSLIMANRHELFTDDGYKHCFGPFLAELRYLIELFKINGHKELAWFFAELLNLEFRRYVNSHILTAIPCSRHNARRRGWDQMAEILKIMSRKYGWRTECLLGRKGKLQQKDLNRVQRQDNAGKNFFLKRNAKHGKYLLLDDVMTTGFSLNACKQLILDQGALEVEIFTLARATGR